MSTITIDKSKCVGCHICSDICPRHLIKFNTQDSYPYFSTKGTCFECGQCMISCPNKAITLDNISKDQLIPIDKKLEITPNELQQFFTSRRSVRNFTNKKVERETLEHLLHIASYSPSAMNWPLVNWAVVDDPNEIHKISRSIAEKFKYLTNNFSNLEQLATGEIKEMLSAYPNLCHEFIEELEEVVTSWTEDYDPILLNAPVLIMAHSDRRILLAHDACITALTQLELIAHGLNLGACWSGLVSLYSELAPTFAKEIGIPNENTIVTAMLVGYPKYKYHSIPYRNPPKVIWK